MDQKVFEKIYEELSPVFSENGFCETEGVFENDNSVYKVEYSEERELFLLLCAEKSESGTADFSEVSSFLFRADSTVADGVAVGMDFADTVMTRLGINRRKQRSQNDVALPTKSNSSTPTLDDLFNKILAIFPQYKDAYLENIRDNGELFYVNFLLTTVCRDIRGLLQSDSDKKLKKIYDSLNELYVSGDRRVSDTIVVVILGGALKGDEGLTEKMLSGLESFPYLKTAVRTVASMSKKDKRLREMYGLQDLI